MPKSKAPAQTFAEVEYLKELVEKRTRLRVKLTSDEEVEGVLEYWDAGFIRLTRDDGPNLFIFKDRIKYFLELPD